MNKLHFSLSDWIFPSPTYMAIRDDQYISSPTSLKSLFSPEALRKEFVWLKSTIAPCVKDGRFIDWYRWSHSTYQMKHILFRSQTTPPLDIPSNCYYLNLRPNFAMLYARQAGIDSLVASCNFTPDLLQNTWYHYRMTWYSYLGEDLLEVMRAVFDIEVEGEWVEKFNIEDSINAFKDSEVNRVGFMARLRSSILNTWVDDTEIWQKTE